ncbi:MAG: UDP-N-acetylmuramoyl-L-alanyl-D-glutamate--2,6-diaminopimelate ligase [Coriobacteriales bacterium]
MTAQMSVADILQDVYVEPLEGASALLEVSSIEFSSRGVTPGALFFCVPGTAADGHDYAADALQRGAAALVVERPLPLNAPQFLVYDARKALALGSARFFGQPSEKLRLVGVTGTNGKTTTTFLVEHMAQVAGETAGLMGTVECHVGSEVRPSLHTTPESRDLQMMLAEMAEAGVGVAALEVSSHAIDLGRILGTRFAVAAFSNLTQDHLDYHKTMEAYFRAKAALFTEHDVERCVICTDGEYGRRLAELCRSVGRAPITVGSAPEADVRLLQASFAPHSTQLSIEAAGQQLQITLPLVGRFNVENALVCFGIGLALGYSTELICRALETAPQVPGRLQRVVGTRNTDPGFGVLVDYAHTPDSVAKAISACKAVTPGRVICVFGCGGDRDATKRPKMGRAALDADIAVVTSDNPRTEDPEAIIAQILPGMEGGEERTHVIADRAQAIRFALGLAQPGDSVLIAGKGHEDYQIIGTTKHHFDDREVAAEGLDELCS